MKDRELIKGCIRENKACQQALYQKYSGKMLAVCTRYARHRLEAEDLVQDGFIKVFNNIHKFKFKGSFEGWVRRIMVNTALKNYKKSSFQKEQIGIQDYKGGVIEPSVMNELSAQEIMKLIAKLPTGYKIVFNLYAIEGYSHREIGNMLDIQESTSRSQLTKARRMLKKMIFEMQKLEV